MSPLPTSSANKRQPLLSKSPTSLKNNKRSRISSACSLLSEGEAFFWISLEKARMKSHWRLQKEIENGSASDTSTHTHLKLTGTQSHLRVVMKYFRFEKKKGTNEPTPNNSERQRA